MHAKYIAGVLAAATLLPGLAFAETNTPMQDQILSLLTQIKALQQQLAAIVASSTTLKPNHEGPNPGGPNPKDDNKPLPPGPAGKNSCVTLTRNLKIGLQGDDVKKLQELLGSDPENGFTASPTGYFGPLTATAMIKFQIRQGIASSSDGTVGPKTRAFFADKCGKGPGPKDDKAPKEQHSAANGTVTSNTGSSITVLTHDGRSVVVNITASTAIKVHLSTSTPPTDGSVADLAIGKMAQSQGTANADGSIDAIHINSGLVPPGKLGGEDRPAPKLPDGKTEKGKKKDPGSSSKL